MEPQTQDKTTSSTLMLPKEGGNEKFVIVSPKNCARKILIREDTIVTQLPGCAGCGRAQFNCSGVKKQWSVLCWGKQLDKRYYLVLVILSAVFALSLIGTVFFCFTNTINDAVLSNMVIRNNSIAYNMWKRPTVQPLMKVYLFNYTNWEKVRSGEEKRLHVEEVGPYVYSQQLERVNVKFDKDHLSFQERNNFRYLPKASGKFRAQHDQVTVPNLPLLGVVSKAKDLNLHLSQYPLNAALFWANHPHAFVKLPVHRFLWGYDDDIIDTAKAFMSITGELKFTKFGLLVTKNGTTSERFTINTGEFDKDKMNVFEKLDGQSQLNYWSTPECNSIEASDGTIFPPSMLDRNMTLHVLYTNLCRRLPFVYEKDVEIADGVQLLRYRMPNNVFDAPPENPSNQCYCELDTGVCPPRGVINVTACAMGAPALASFPHFYLGDPKLRENVTGLKPNPELHTSYLDIHPTLGIALSGKSSLQLNIQVRKTSAFSMLTFLEDDLILPIAWIEMGVEELPESLRTLVYHGTFSTAAAQLGLAMICIVGLIFSSICLLVMIIRKRQRPCATLKKIAVEMEHKPQLS